MESEQDAMASPAAKQIAAAQPLLPDEILEEIFLLLDSGADLARASATCRSFRRVATGHRFLRRFLSLHPPPIVGIICHDERTGLHSLHPVEPPHQSAPAARAIAQAGDSSFSFLPSDPDPNRSWIVRDVRDGRFLLARKGTVDAVFLELVVCDPLYRRYVQIPSIPGDLLPRMPSKNEMKAEPFLAPAGDEAETEENRNFRVIYNFVSNYKIVSIVFSVATRKWGGVTSFSLLPARLIELPKRLVRYYAHGCFYWVGRFEKYMLMLDPLQMKFSLVELLRLRDRNPRKEVGGLAVMDAVEGRLGLLVVGGSRLDIYSRTCQINGVGAEEWRHDKCLPLPELDYVYSIIGAAEGYILLSGAAPISAEVFATLRSATGYTILSSLVRKARFAVNLKTLLVERLSMLNNDAISRAHPYARFPSPLSLPSL